MSKTRQELLEDMRNEADRMRLELRQEFLSQHVYAESVEVLVSPAHKSTKGSFAAPSTSGEDIIDQMSQCELLVEAACFLRWCPLEKSIKRPPLYITFLSPLMWRR